jgi:hypothetical protein
MYEQKSYERIPNDNQYQDNSLTETYSNTTKNNLSQSQQVDSTAKNAMNGEESNQNPNQENIDNRSPFGASTANALKETQQ